MAICPFAVWMPVVNHGDDVVAHQGLVVHVQMGDHSTYTQDNTVSSQVSNDFWCGKDGTLQQMVDTEKVAWTQMAGNAYYTSVETEGFVGDPLTDQQVAMLARLFVWGHETYGWPMQTCDHGGQGLTTHAHYDSGAPDASWGGHPCPGAVRSAQLPAILAAAQALVGGGKGTHPTDDTPAFPGTDLSYPPTTSGPGVATWQSQMLHRGSSLAIDGQYGPASKAACEAFQTQFHLTVDGVVGPITWNATWNEPIRAAAAAEEAEIDLSKTPASPSAAPAPN
jgi:peptidoglycan hydrolase-like protein with peptidoglycan-binding domain